MNTPPRITLIWCVSVMLISPSIAGEVLTRDDFQQIGKQGFGLRGNSYAWCSAYFRGKVYIGTNHNFLCLVRSIRGVTDENAQQEASVECDPDLLSMDFRGRIYAYDPATRAIELVHISPTIKALRSDGTQADVAVDMGYRTMAVFREPDGTEALYVGTFTTTELPGAPPRILRSTDGLHFKPLPGDISQDGSLVSYRGLTVFRDKLYAIGIGRLDADTVLLESADPAGGVFRRVNPPNFGDPVNISAFELAVFKGYLYIGTATASEGFQLLKTRADGAPPYVFQPVLVDGAYRGSKNQNVVSLQPFGDYLYVGTGINFVALDFFPGVESAAAELIRVRADDSWEIVCGAPRDTPAGPKDSVTGLIVGCNNSRTGYIWRMVEHDGVLYMGTFDMSLFARFVGSAQIESAIDFDAHPLLAQFLDFIPAGEIADVISALDGGFDLWATEDGDTWRLISRSGLGDEFAYGLRTFTSTPHGLFVGTANPYYGMRVLRGDDPDRDRDGDGHPDRGDNCPTLWNLHQSDLDNDGIGDACDPDDDGDCILDDVDPRPTVAAVPGPDTDRDGTPDGCDTDDDDDTIPDHQDNCPLVANFDQADADGDGVGDACAPADPPAAQTGNDNDNAADDDVGGDVVAPNGCGAGVGWALVATWGLGFLLTRRP